MPDLERTIAALNEENANLYRLNDELRRTIVWLDVEMAKYFERHHEEHRQLILGSSDYTTDEEALDRWVDSIRYKDIRDMR